MLGLLLTGNPMIDLLIDGVLLIGMIGAVGYLAYLRYSAGAFWRFLKSRFLVIAIGKDRMARIIEPRTMAGQFLDLGRYGKAFTHPDTIYRVFNSPRAQHIAVVYLPYAITQDVEKMAAITGAKYGVYKVKEVRGRVKDEEGNEREEVVDAEIHVSDPIAIKVSEIEEWQSRAYNPIVLETAIDYARKATSEELESSIRTIKYLIVFVLIMTIASVVIGAVMK